MNNLIVFLLIFKFFLLFGILVEGIVWKGVLLLNFLEIIVLIGKINLLLVFFIKFFVKFILFFLSKDKLIL